MAGEGTSIAVMLPKIARKTLGIAEGGFSQIAIQGNSVVFQGQGHTRPVLRPVSILGTFHGDLLTNLFLYLSNNQQNGILAVTTGPLTKALFFKRGNIVFGGTTDARERIGNVLLRLGYVTPQQIAEVEAHEDPRRFGVRVKDAGFITHDQLWEALRTQVAGVCHSLVNFPVGTFFFLPGCVPDDAFTHFKIDPTHVLFQGMVRMDERNHHAGYDPEALEGCTPMDVLSAMEDE